MNPTAQLIGPEIRELVADRRFSELRAALHNLPPADIAETLADLGAADAALAFRFLPREEAGEVFSYFQAETQEEILHELGASAVRVIEGMDPDDRADLLDELPPELAQRLVAAMSPEDRKETLAILGYPPESVGRLMTPDYVRLSPEWTIAHALEHIRKHGRDAETINWMYIVDAAGRLVAEVFLRRLLLSDPDKSVRDIMDDQFLALSATDDREEAVRQMSRYDRTALPVVDSQRILLGIVTFDDVADVAEEEATEDIQKLGGVEALDQPYMRTGTGEMLRKRGVWLMLLFLGESITILVLSYFADDLDKAIILAVFVPLIIACGGNSGTQASSLLIRALALKEVRPRDWHRIIRKEAATGAILGLALGCMGVAAVLLWQAIGLATSEEPTRVALAVGSAIVGCVVWGTFLGSMFPLMLEKLGFDPAVSSSPLVATLMDASGMIIYMTIAVLLLRGTLL